MFVNISTGNVGIGTLNASNISISGSSVGIGGGGGILANVGWTPTTEPYPTLTLPSGGAFAASRSNGQHLWVGNEVQYTFNVAGTVTAAPTNTALDYTISVPYPVAVAASYPADTIVGDLWLTVVYAGNSNLFKAYARTLSTDANSLIVRAITGTTDESLGTLLAGSVITLQGTATYASTSVNQNTGGALAAGLQTVWIPSTAVNWAPTTSAPVFTLPAGAALTYSRSNARYMYVGTDVTYNVDIGGTLTASPTSAASDYLLSVPYAVATATYTNPTIVGELWLSVVNGVNSNTFKSYARTLTGGNASNVALRMLTGTADEAFGALTSGSTFTLQGTLKYTTTAANSNIGVPTSYIAANFRQDVAGNVGLNTGSSNIRAKFDVIQSSNIPALVVDQYGTGDALQVKDGGVTQLVVSGTGNVGIGTGNPLAKLHVLDTSAIVISSGLPTQQPTNAIQGMIRFNTSSKRLEFYNGTSWMSISGSDVYNVYLTNVMLHLDPSELTSYPRAATVWYDLSEKRTNAVGTVIDFRSTVPEYFNFNGTTAFFDLQISNTAGAWVHSISFWMQINVAQSSLTNTGVPFQIGTTAGTSQYSAMLIDVNGGSWFFYSNDATFTYSFNQNQWYNIILTYNGGNANSTNKKMYINNINVPLTSTSTTPLNIAANSLMSIGRDRGRNAYYFPGKIGNFMIYNSVLDASAIAQNFTALRSRYSV